ncbi:Programmed cell death protein 2 [Smittium culicis]|uniref:Programmed cell death protein 2 n=1 Tax=Smittium culicis TaxID=133412 RepID=A0A1R1YFL7_9FUNG|nr:Programmed cell death protein 2 [Smittium culicis]
MLDYVLLSYADGPLNAKDENDPFISKFGGKPTWLSNKNNTIFPQGNILKCDNCASLMLLIFQIYAPLPDSPYERFIYLWGCNKKDCMKAQGSFKVIRGHLLNKDYLEKLSKTKNKKKPSKSNKAKTKLAPKQVQESQPKQKTKFDFGSIWDTDEIDNNASTTEAEIKDITKSESFTSSIIPKLEKDKSSSIKTEETNSTPKNKAKPAKIISNIDSIISSMNDLSISNKNTIPNILPYAPAQYLDSEYEHLDSFSDSNISENFLSKNMSTGKQNIKISNDENDNSESWASEAYESTILPNGIDSALDIFMGIVSQNPEQILRYQFSGTPLFYSIDDEVSKLLLIPPKNPKKNNIKSNQALASSSNINKLNPEKNTAQNQQLNIHAKAAKPKIDGARGYGIGSDDDDDDDDEDVSNNGDSSEKNQISYSTDNVPVCQYCKGKRTFELQVLPSIIHIMGFDKLSNNINTKSIIEPSNNQPLKTNADTTNSKKPNIDVPNNKNTLIKGKDFMESIDSGMEFGTILIYSCKNDCHLGSSVLPDLSNAKEIEKFSIPQYYQEVVYTQLETHLD